MSSTFQIDATSALQPLLAQYGLKHVLVTPDGAAAFDVFPPNIPSLPAGFHIGWNVGGTWPTNSAITDSAYSIPQLITDIAPFGSDRIVRVWQTGPITKAPDLSQFVQTQKLAAAGFKVIMVWNTENNGGKAPADFGASYFKGMPPASQTGIWAVELVNEHDSTQYFNDTPQNLANIFKTSGPLCHALGYQVIGSNALESLGFYSNATVRNVLKGNVDYIGRHAYELNGTDAIAAHVKVKALADSLGLGYISTETGLHKPRSYPQELQVMWAGLEKLGGIYCAFTLYKIANGQPTINDYACWPYDAPGVTNANFAAIKTGLGV